MINLWDYQKWIIGGHYFNFIFKNYRYHIGQPRFHAITDLLSCLCVSFSSVAGPFHIRCPPTYHIESELSIFYMSVDRFIPCHWYHSYNVKEILYKLKLLGFMAHDFKTCKELLLWQPTYPWPNIKFEKSRTKHIMFEMSLRMLMHDSTRNLGLWQRPCLRGNKDKINMLTVR